jgi:hypothetical protein
MDLSMVVPFKQVVFHGSQRGFSKLARVAEALKAKARSRGVTRPIVSRAVALSGVHLKKLGEDGLRQLLEHDVSNPILSREDVMDAADELGRAGLRKAASIATEIAATKPPMTDLRFCCYTKPPYVGQVGNVRNIEAWQRAEERRQSDAAHKRRRKKTGRGWHHDSRALRSTRWETTSELHLR